MLFSPRYNFLFVHIAKTGGTSIRAALRQLQRRDPLYPLMFICSRMSHLTGHRLGSKFPRHAKIIAAKEMLPAALFERLFKFAFVRNPWDLQVSSYHHIRRERPALLAGHEAFTDFLDWKLDPDRPYQYHIDTSIEQQRDYLVDLHGQLCVDFIGHYETLASDYASIQAKLAAQLPPLPHKRRASDRQSDYRTYYSDRTAALVADHFAGDIAAFGYRFD